MKPPDAKLQLYDTTLRDGAQSEDIAFSLEDKLRIARSLDDLGVHYIEGGWPGANPKEMAFFRAIRRAPLKTAQLVAFGSTRRASSRPSQDPNLRALLAAGTSVITIFGKSWDLHVTRALGVSLDMNLAMIADSIVYLRARGKRVFYDAEHFFDGYKANPDYALATLRAARDAGAECLILCDTNGGTMPWEVREIMEAVARAVAGPFGIHAHNDAEMAVANSLVAVQCGATQVQGTINGYGERCGNANLCSIIATLKLKMRVDCITDERLRQLRQASRLISEVANQQPNPRQAYVGESAFAHKGGVHVHAVRRHPPTYEHVEPEGVGNRRRILVSEHAGRSTLMEKAKEFKIAMPRDARRVRDLLKTLKALEHQGYQFEGAEASLELLIKKATGAHRRFFDLLGFRVVVEKRQGRETPVAEATITVRVGTTVKHTSAVGRGPVNALDNALRKALEKFYPELRDVRLLDYKVRVLSAGRGTASRVRVLIESGSREARWGTVGVSENIIEASWEALVDSIEYRLLKQAKRRTGKAKAGTDAKD